MIARIVIGLLIVPCGDLFAQCRPSKDSNEARLLAFYEAPMVFSPFTGVDIEAHLRIRAGGEIVPVPNPSAELRRTGACFTQKSENTDIAPVFARPRIIIGLARGLSIEGSYVPPIKVSDAEPHIGSAAIAFTRPLTIGMGGEPRFTVRAHGTIGRVRGPITCPEKALQQSDASRPCYGTRPSTDTFRPRMFGLETAAGWGTVINRLSGYAGLGVNWLRPRFQVGFTDGSGNVDTTRVEVDLTRLALFTGVTFHASRRLDLGFQVYSVPEDVTTIRFSGAYRLR